MTLNWAFIADLYLPILAVSVAVSLVVGLRRNRIRRLTSLSWAFGIVYGWMLVDIFLNIWPSFHADYSTHTALAWIFVGYFCVFGNTIAKLSAVVSLFWYCELMHRLSYHSYLDMISTSLVIFPLIVIAFKKHNAL